MKKMLMSVISVILVVCLMIPTVAFAADKGTEYSSVQEYVDSSVSVETGFSRAVNALSNFVINGVLGTALKLIIPDSAAVEDYEKFNIDEYDNFYAGMDKFIDEPQGDKVWSLGYGKASVLPEDFSEK